MMTSCPEPPRLSEGPETLVAGQWIDGPKVLLVDPSSLSRSCTLVGLAPILGVLATAVSSLGEVPPDIVPDIVIFQNFRIKEAISALPLQIKIARERWSGCATVVVTDEHESSEISEGLRTGAQAVLTNSVGVETLVDALRLVCKGFAVYPLKALDIVREAMRAGDAPGRPEPFLNDLDFDRDRFSHLTVRQRDVLRLLSLGLSNKAIGVKLNISESTVKVHLRSIMEQTGVTNRTQIIAHFMARKAGENLRDGNGSDEAEGRS